MLSGSFLLLARWFERFFKITKDSFWRKPCLKWQNLLMAIINNDTKLMNYILSCAILCSAMDPVDYDINAEYIVAEFNAVFRHFSTTSTCHSNVHFCKLDETLFSVMECLKGWMQRIINLSIKTKKPTSNGNILALRRI